MLLEWIEIEIEKIITKRDIDWENRDFANASSPGKQTKLVSHFQIVGPLLIEWSRADYEPAYLSIIWDRSPYLAPLHIIYRLKKCSVSWKMVDKIYIWIMKLSCEFCLIPNLVQRGHHKTSLTLVHTKYLKNNFFFCSQITFNLRKEKKKWKSTNFTIIFRNLFWYYKRTSIGMVVHQLARI